MALVKHVIRFGVLGSLGLGTAAVVAGPDRVGALFSEARSAVNTQIDKHITDPVALRAQLRSLAEQYPHRIGEVRSDLAQLKGQVGQLTRDMTVSQRVIELADADSNTLSLLMSKADAATIQQASYDGGGVEHRVVLVFNNERLSLPEAQTRAQRINATRNAYASRVADIQRDMGYLSQQERQMTQLLTKLEAEQTTFQTQMFDLDRQIDSIARNDRMIDIMSDRQQTLDEQSRYRATSLDQINGKLGDIRARQEATLQSLAGIQAQSDYEDQAKMELDRDAGSAAMQRSLQPILPRARPTIIEITPNSALPNPAPALPGAEAGKAKSIVSSARQ